MKKFVTGVGIFLMLVVFFANVEGSEWGDEVFSNTLPKQIVPFLEPVPVREIINDPAGDDIKYSVGEDVDVVSIYAGAEKGKITIKAEFSDVTRMDLVGGHLDLNTDKNSLTGVQASGNLLVPNTNQTPGIEFYFTYFKVNSAGEVELWNAKTREKLAAIPAQVEGQTISFTFPMDLIQEDGYLYITSAFGNQYGATDAGPNNGHGDLSAPGTVTISPASSQLSDEQVFDIVFFVFSTNQQVITKVKILLDGGDVTASVWGRATFRKTMGGTSWVVTIPQVRGRDLMGGLGDSFHTLRIILTNSLGEFENEVVYRVVPTMQPYQF